MFIEIHFKVINLEVSLRGRVCRGNKVSLVWVCRVANSCEPDARVIGFEACTCLRRDRFFSRWVMSSVLGLRVRTLEFMFGAMSLVLESSFQAAN